MNEMFEGMNHFPGILYYLAISQLFHLPTLLKTADLNSEFIVLVGDSLC